MILNLSDFILIIRNNQSAPNLGLNELFDGDFNITGTDLRDHITSAASFNVATHRAASTEDFQDGSLKFTSQRLDTGLTGDFDDLIEGERSVMLDVLFLLAITRGFLKSLNDQTSSRRFQFNGSDTVGNSKLDTETETFIFKGGLGDIVLNLLGGDTERTNLLSKSVTGTFTTDGTDVDCKNDKTDEDDAE